MLRVWCAAARFLVKELESTQAPLGTEEGVVGIERHFMHFIVCANDKLALPPFHWYRSKRVLFAHTRSVTCPVALDLARASSITGAERHARPSVMHSHLLYLLSETDVSRSEAAISLVRPWSSLISPIHPTIPLSKSPRNLHDRP